MTQKPKVAVIGAGGTICSIGTGPFDIKGIISSGFAPGFVGPDDFDVLKAAAKAGVIVTQSTRAGSGRTFKGKRLREAGFLITDNLTPQKACLLLMLALTVTQAPAEIECIFLTY